MPPAAWQQWQHAECSPAAWYGRGGTAQLWQLHLCGAHAGGAWDGRAAACTRMGLALRRHCSHGSARGQQVWGQLVCTVGMRGWGQCLRGASTSHLSAGVRAQGEFIANKSATSGCGLVRHVALVCSLLASGVATTVGCACSSAAPQRAHSGIRRVGGASGWCVCVWRLDFIGAASSCPQLLAVGLVRVLCRCWQAVLPACDWRAA
jgi:hypothetical protein